MPNGAVIEDEVELEVAKLSSESRRCLNGQVVLLDLPAVLHRAEVPGAFIRRSGDGDVRARWSPEQLRTEAVPIDPRSPGVARDPHRGRHRVQDGLELSGVPAQGSLVPLSLRFPVRLLPRDRGPAPLVEEEPGAGSQRNDHEQRDPVPEFLAPRREHGVGVPCERRDEEAVRQASRWPDCLEDHQGVLAGGLERARPRGEALPAPDVLVEKGVRHLREVHPDRALHLGHPVDDEPTAVGQRGRHVGRVAGRVEQEVEVLRIDDGEEVAVECSVLVEDDPAQAERPVPERRGEGRRDVELRRIGAAPDRAVPFPLVVIEADELLPVAGDSDPGTVHQDERAHAHHGRDQQPHAVVQAREAVGLGEEDRDVGSERIEGVGRGLKPGAEHLLDDPPLVREPAPLGRLDLLVGGAKLEGSESGQGD